MPKSSAKPKKRNRRLTMQEKRDLMEKLNGKLTADELEYLNTLVNRQIKEACEQTTRRCIATAYGVIFRVLTDKFEFVPSQLQQLWNHVDDYSRMLKSGELRLKDILDSLRDEDDINLLEDADDLFDDEPDGTRKGE